MFYIFQNEKSFFCNGSNKFKFSFDSIRVILTEEFCKISGLTSHLKEILISELIVVIISSMANVGAEKENCISFWHQQMWLFHFFFLHVFFHPV